MKLFWLNLQHQKSDILIKYSYSQTQEIWRNVYSEHIQIQEQESIPTLPAFVVLLTAPHQCLHCYSNLVFLSSPQERLSQDCLPRLTQKVSSSLSSETSHSHQSSWYWLVADGHSVKIFEMKNKPIMDMVRQEKKNPEWRNQVIYRVHASFYCKLGPFTLHC